MTIVFSNLNSYIYMNKSRDVKLQLFRATTETILLYGSSAWTLTKEEEKVLNGTYMRMLRLISYWSDKLEDMDASTKRFVEVTVVVFVCLFCFVFFYVC